MRVTYHVIHRDMIVTPHRGRRCFFAAMRPGYEACVPDALDGHRWLGSDRLRPRLRFVKRGAVRDQVADVFPVDGFVGQRLHGVRVRVVHIGNDPFNYIVNEYGMQSGVGGFVGAAGENSRFAHQWYRVHEIAIGADQTIRLYLKTAPDPATSPREAAGPMDRLSELLRFYVRYENLEDDPLVHVPYGRLGRGQFDTPRRGIVRRGCSGPDQEPLPSIIFARRTIGEKRACQA